MPQTAEATGGIALVHTALGDFFVPEEGALHAEVRETGGHSRAGLAMLSSRLGPGDTVLDLGAGAGMLAVPLRRLVGPAGCVWCFEPDQAAAGLLHWNLALNGVDLLTRVVAGEAWPRLDEWCAAAGVERVDAVCAHGTQAAAALAGGGRATLARHLPLVLLTREYGSAPGTDDGDPLIAELTRLGYSFHSGADTSEAEAGDGTDPLAAESPHAGSVLAVPPGKGAGGADE